MSDGVRFTAFLSPRERAAITEAARRERTSANFIVRSAIRVYLGLDKPSQLSHVLHVTSATSETEE